MAKLIALIDGSVYARSVCEHALWVAERIGAGIEVVHVLGRRELSSIPVAMSGTMDMSAGSLLIEQLSELDRQRAKLSEERGRLMLQQASSILRAAGAQAVTTVLHHGDLVESVPDFDSVADLLVIGKRGEGADFAKLHLGSNLERVARSSTKPVFVASRAFRPIQRFIVAFDNGPSVTRAIEYLATSGLVKGLDGCLVHVGRVDQEMRRAAEEAVATLTGAGCSMMIEFVPGQPEEAIAEKVESDRVDLLVMGAYGHSRLRNLILGSTSEEMIRSCKIPILLVH